MPKLAVGRFRPVFDFRQQRRFDPNPPVRDLFGVRLSFPDQRFKPCLQILYRRAVKAVIDFAGIDWILAYRRIGPTHFTKLHATEQGFKRKD
jgi:hypothetical protein